MEGPPGFSGLNPHLPVRIYHRHLPHWRQERATYVVTFRQSDSLPQSRVNEIKALRREWERLHPEPRSEADWKDYARQYTRRVDAWLDEGYGSCRFRGRDAIEFLGTAMTKFHGQRYHTGAYAVMPNHCHLIFRPFDGEELEKLVGSIKGSVARAIGRTNSNEPLWIQESYDRIIRDEEHLAHTISYIGRNPMMAGLAHEQSRRCWIAEDWRAAGWDFDPPQDYILPKRNRP